MIAMSVYTGHYTSEVDYEDRGFSFWLAWSSFPISLVAGEFHGSILKHGLHPFCIVSSFFPNFLLFPEIYHLGLIKDSLEANSLWVNPGRVVFLTIQKCFATGSFCSVLSTLQLV